MNLFKRLQKKLQISEGALKKRIQRKANELGISTKIALPVLSSIENVSIQNELKKMEPEEKSIFQLAISNIKKEENSISMNKTPASKHSFKKKHIVEQDNLFLDNRIINEAYKMAEKAYLILYFFENSLRNFINKVMTNEFGSNWWDTKMTTKKLKRIAEEVERREVKDKNLYWHSKRKGHELNYSDFDHLKNIIDTYSSNFKKYFIGRHKETYWITSKIFESFPSRNVTAHNNPLTDKDIKRLEANYSEWHDQIKYIEKNFTF